MTRIAAAAAAICAAMMVAACTASPTAGSSSAAGGAANFGTPGVGGDALPTPDAAKADSGAAADGTAETGDASGVGSDGATVGDSDAGVSDEVAEPPDAEMDDGEPSTDAATDVAAKPDVVVADGKSDAKSDAGKDGANDSAGAPGFAAVFDGLIKKYACNSPYCHAEQIGTTATAAYPKLIAWKAVGKACQGKAAVVAGDPAASLLWAKIAPGVAACDEKMPPGGGSGVSTDDAKLVYDWIAAGAKP